jgi:penicillin-binding protein 1A
MAALRRSPEVSMSPSRGERPVVVRAAGRLVGMVVRLALIAVIAGTAGVLIGILFLPAALATNDVLAAVRTDVLDVAPLGEADRPPENSFIYDADGQLLAELTFEENRNPVTLNQVPQVVIDAVLATEDASYYEHEGVNHMAIVRAALTNWRTGGIESGASTITQQYVKLAFLSPEQTIQRKVEEAIYAIQLEERMSKDQILELYLNRAYFGAGTYGIGTAADRYFSKDIGDLTLGEAATLAGLLRAPEANNPINNPQNAQDRRDIVLRQMATHGFISHDQAFTEIDKPLEPNISEPPPPEYPFWTRWVSELLTNSDRAEALGTQTDALDAMGATREERIRRVFQSGLRIHTTLDPQLQDLAEQALIQHLTYEDEPPEEIAREPMGSIVSVEPGTGAIRAMAIGPHTFGSCTEDDSWVDVDEDTRQLFCDRTTVNPAVPGMGGSGRQPGSAFKPFLAAAALEDGISPGLTLDARGPQDIEGCANPWEVRNAGGDDILDMYEAMARSSNVYHALLVAEIGPEKLVDVAQRLGISANLPNECALALGAGEVTPLDMANAFATLFNRGEYCAPFPITHIEDRDGNVLWEHRTDCRQVIDEEVADRTVDLMKGVVEGGGTASVANLGDWPTRGKTGTTNDYVDAWFVGGVRQLSTAAWMGYQNGTRFYESEEAAADVCGSDRFLNRCPPARQTLQNVTIAGQDYARVFGGTIPAPMWATYMTEAVKRFEPEGFPDPGPIPMGRVPDLLVAGSMGEAEEIALEAGYRVEFEQVEDYRPAGTFIDQNPEAGTQLPLGNRIIVAVSDGEGDLPEVPDVTGMTLDDAAEVLFEHGFRVGKREVEVDDEDLDGIVVEQDPEGGTGVDPDEIDMVVLSVGVYVEPEEEEEEDDEEEEGGGNGGGGGGPGPPEQPGPPGNDGEEG